MCHYFNCHYLRLLIATVIITAVTGCSSTMRNYEKLTSQVAADLDTKMDQYVRDTKDFDAIRETSQRRQEMQTAAAKAAVTMHVDLLGLTDDPRQKLFTKLQDASNHVLIMRLQQLSATVSLTTLSSPKEIADIVKALDQLARELSPSDQTKELIEYFKEVYNDLNNDQKAKSAENSISKAGASSK